MTARPHFVDAQILEALGVDYVLVRATSWRRCGICARSWGISARSPRAKANVEATTNFADPHIVAKVSRGLGDAMTGLEIDKLETKLAERGW